MHLLVTRPLLVFTQAKHADNGDTKKELKDYLNIFPDDRMMHWDAGSMMIQTITIMKTHMAWL